MGSIAYVNPYIQKTVTVRFGPSPFAYKLRDFGTAEGVAVADCRRFYPLDTPMDGEVWTFHDEEAASEEVRNLLRLHAPHGGGNAHIPGPWLSEADLRVGCVVVWSIQVVMVPKGDEVRGHTRYCPVDWREADWPIVR